MIISDSNDQIISFSEGTFSSVPHSSGEYYGFDVLLQEPIHLEKAIIYCLKARITGPHSWYGTQGNSSVKCSDVTFTLKDKTSGGTNTKQGQFNEFIFSLGK